MDNESVLNLSSKCFIIAELGVNHNGQFDLAVKLINEAARAGVDAVKFQTFKAEKVISKFAPKAEYQKKTTSLEESQLEMVKKLQLSEEEQLLLKNHCQDKGVMFISSPFDLESIDFLSNLGLEIFKIPSGEITNLPYLRKIGRLNKKLIVSTGMADLEEIAKALDILVSAGTLKDNIIILHCNTEYPAPYEDVNLKAMLTIKNAFGVAVGYSDHSLGIEVPIAAAALGACVIEKHFTLDKNMPGPDHKASLEPLELKTMVKAIRNIGQALGDGIKKPSPSEFKNRLIARKSIIASRQIRKGEVFTAENITVKRPGMGINPMDWDKVIGRAAARDFTNDEAIEL